MVDRATIEAGRPPEPGNDPSQDEIAAARQVNDAGADQASDKRDTPIQHEGAAPAGQSGDEKPPLSLRELTINSIAEKRRRQIEESAGVKLDGEGDAGAAGTATGEGDPAGQAAADGDAAGSAGTEARPGAVAAATEAAATMGADDTVELKVNGKIKKVTRDELIALAQKGASSDEVFKAAARLREDAERRAAEAEAARATGGARQDSTSTPTPAEPAAAQGDGQGDRRPTASAADPGDRKARAAEIRRALQYGEESEAETVIEKLLEEIEGRSATPPSTEEIGTIVTRVLEQRQVQTSYQSDLEKIGKDFADVLTDEDLSTLAAERVHKERAKDLIAAGVNEDEVNAALKTPQGRNMLLSAHLTLHGQGKVARSNYDVFRDACQDVKSRFVRPSQTQSPAAGSPARQDAKRQLPQSPAPASARTTGPKEAPPPSRSDAIKDMRRARGLPA
jgi:hypothetical protein